MMTKINVKNSIIFSILGVGIVFALWFLLYFIVANAYVIPSPIEVVKASFSNLLSLEFYGHFFSTLLRVIFAIAISFVLGIFFAILSHLFTNVEHTLLPIVSIVRSLPVLAILLIILICASRVIAPTIVCVLSLFPIVYSQTLSYLNSISIKEREMLKLYNVPIKKQIFSVYLKGYLPFFVKEATALFSFSLKLVVSAEILANVFQSIGGDIFQASIYANVMQMFSLTLLVCVVGIIVEFIGNVISRKMEKKFQ